MELTPGQVSGMINAAVFFSTFPILTSELISRLFHARIGACGGHSRAPAPCPHRNYVECHLTHRPQFAMVIYPVFGLVSAEES